MRCRIHEIQHEALNRRFPMWITIQVEQTSFRAKNLGFENGMMEILSQINVIIGTTCTLFLDDSISKVHKALEEHFTRLIVYFISFLCIVCELLKVLNH
jgi:hypothetical protein